MILEGNLQNEKKTIFNLKKIPSIENIDIY